MSRGRLRTTFGPCSTATSAFLRWSSLCSLDRQPGMQTMRSHGLVFTTDWIVPWAVGNGGGFFFGHFPGVFFSWRPWRYVGGPAWNRPPGWSSGNAPGASMNSGVLGWQRFYEFSHHIRLSHIFFRAEARCSPVVNAIDIPAAGQPFFLIDHGRPPQDLRTPSRLNSSMFFQWPPESWARPIAGLILTQGPTEALVFLTLACRQPTSL